MNTKPKWKISELKKEVLEAHNKVAREYGRSIATCTSITRRIFAAHGIEISLRDSIKVISTFLKQEPLNCFGFDEKVGWLASYNRTKLISLYERAQRSEKEIKI